MMPASALSLALGFAGGAAFGAVHLGLLWASVRALTRASWGHFAMLALLRAATAAGALWLAIALGAGAAGLAAAVIGFVALRVAVTRRVGARDGRSGAWR